MYASGDIWKFLMAWKVQRKINWEYENLLTMILNKGKSLEDYKQ